METQDHQKPTQSGHDGHGGSHICHKCGWPFPNPHPSARHRRAHKRVCGTIEGYRLDNTQEKARLDGSDGEHVSDDDHQNKSGKVVERTISRKSSSGVGSASIRSTRSEDEVFADAVTDFADSSDPGEVCGAISRGNSLQSITESDQDGTRLVVESASADHISISNILLADKVLQTAKTMGGENDKVEASVLPRDDVASLTNNPGASVEEVEEVVSSKDLSEPRITYPEKPEETSEDCSVLKDVGEEIQNSISASGMVEPTGTQTTGFKDNIVCFDDVDSPGNCHGSVLLNQVVETADNTLSKTGYMIEVHDPNIKENESFYVLSVPDALPLRENPEVAVEDLDHKGGKFNISVIPEATLAVENMKYSNAHGTEENCSSTDFVETRQSSCVDDVFKNDHSMKDILKQELGQNNSIVEQNTVGEQDKKFEVGPSSADINEFRSEALEDMKTESWKTQKVSCHTDEQKSIVSSEDVSAEVAFVSGGDIQDTTVDGDTGASDNIKHDVEEFGVQGNDVSKVLAGESTGTCSTMDEKKSTVSSEDVSPEVAFVSGGDIQDTTADGDAGASDSIRHDVEEFGAQGNEVSKVLVGELTGTCSTMAEPAVNGIALKVKELADVNDSKKMGYDENVGVEGTALNGNEVKIGGEEEKELANAKNAPLSRLIIAGSDDKNDDSSELDRNNDQGNSHEIIDSTNLVGHLQPERLLASSSVGGVQNVGDNIAGECFNRGNMGAVGKTDHHLDSVSKKSGDDGSSFDSSVSVAVDGCIEKLAENAISVPEGDRIIKQQAAVSAVDIVDFRSPTDSLEGSEVSVPVLSAVSDASPATDVTASNNSKASAEAGTVCLDPKAVGDDQHAERKTPTDSQPRNVPEEMQSLAEIQSSQNQEQLSSALRTGASPEVAHVAKELCGRKSDEENIQKVDNCNTTKQHNALKTLLGEASAKSRAESPNHDDIPATKNGFSAKTENLIHGFEDSKSDVEKEEIGKEWDSPARYPVNIKTEKRRGKGRPYWAPFLCCSSVNAR